MIFNIWTVRLKLLIMNFESGKKIHFSCEKQEVVRNLLNIHLLHSKFDYKSQITAHTHRPIPISFDLWCDYYFARLHPKSSSIFPFHFVARRSFVKRRGATRRSAIVSKRHISQIEFQKLQVHVQQSSSSE